MVFRRTFLKLLGTAIAFIATKPVVEATAAINPPVDLEDFVPDVVLPKWCPKGWVPEVGQTISARQFPELFTVVARGDKLNRKFYPPYHGCRNATLPVNVKWPDLDDMRSYGFQDSLTNIKRNRPEDRVMVGMTATEPMRGANGKVALPGWSLVTLVRPEDFSEAYPNSKPYFKPPQQRPQALRFDDQEKGDVSI